MHTPFAETLHSRGLELRRETTRALQINVGLLCNLHCKHCHVEAGPQRTEMMDETTARQVVDYARRGEFRTIDITGGAPEMNPNISLIIESLAPHVDEIMVRSNLTLLKNDILDTLVANRVTIVASLPSLSKSQTESQRGDSVFDRSIEALKRLNERGYGVEGSGLVLHLAANPTGAFLSPSQAAQETRFKTEMKRKYDVTFTHLLAFANVPLGRFEQWLVDRDALGGYYRKLVESFNPCALGGVMCRTQVSVNWDGYLFDCDFHLAEGLGMGNETMHITHAPAPPPPGAPIALADYCYTCVAGNGFSCGGAVAEE